VSGTGVNVNLNGHTVFGTGTPGDHVGIHLLMASTATVRNGTVTGFDSGIAIQGGSSNTVSGIYSHDNVGFLDGSGTFGDGVGIFSSTNNLITNSRVVHNGPFEGIGVFGHFSKGNRIVGNQIKKNDIVGTFLGAVFTLDDGINLGSGLEGSTGTKIAGNVITDNGLNGIDACSIRGFVCLTTDNVIVGNKVLRNGFVNFPPTTSCCTPGDGIHMIDLARRPDGTVDFNPPARSVIAGNTVKDNAGEGITLNVTQTKIIGNVSLGNGQAGFGQLIDLDDLGGDGTCAGNVWSGNTFDIGAAFPDCTMANGHPVGGSPSVALAQLQPKKAAPQDVGVVPQRRFPES